MKQVVVDSRSHLAGKIFWSLAPLVWGALTWFLAYGQGSVFPLSYAMRMVLGVMILSWYFYKPLNKAYHKNRVQLLGYHVSLLNWKILVSISVILLIFYQIISVFIPYSFLTVFNSVVFGVFASACMEEFLARAFFVKYKMSGFEFVVFNTISAIAFTLMHAGYSSPTPSLYKLFYENGHFLFSFMLGIVAYKTQRIETTMFLHMASNFVRYTVPQLIIGSPNHPIVWLIYGLIELLIIGFAVRTNKK